MKQRQYPTERKEALGEVLKDLRLKIAILCGVLDIPWEPGQDPSEALSKCILKVRELKVQK